MGLRRKVIDRPLGVADLLLDQQNVLRVLVHFVLPLLGLGYQLKTSNEYEDVVQVEVEVDI